MPPREPLLNHASSSSNSVYDGGDFDEEEVLRLSSSDSSEGLCPAISKLNAPDTDVTYEISNDLAELQELRKSLQENLRLRPIRSKGKLPKLNNNEARMNMPGAFPMSAKLRQEFDPQSPMDPEIGSAATNAGNSALATLLGHTKRERGASQVTRVSGDIGDVVATSEGSPTASSSLPSGSTTPTKLRSKSRSRMKQPPSALVIHGLSSLTSYPSDVTGVIENEIIAPPHQHTNSAILDGNPDSPQSSDSTTSSIVSSYFTPVGDIPIAKYVYESTLPTISSEPENEEESGSHTASLSTELSSSTTSASPTTAAEHPIVSQNRLTSDKLLPISAPHLFLLLLKGFSGHPRPLVIDTRAPAAHAASRICGSVNIAIPSLILKRCRKMTASSMLPSQKSDFGPNSTATWGGVQTGGKGGFQSMEALKQFVVGERAKEDWNVMLNSLHRADGRTVPGELVWDGNVIVYDEEIDQDVAETTWTLMEVILPLVGRHGGKVYHLEGGIVKGIRDSQMRKMVEFGPVGSNGAEEYSIHLAKKSATNGLFQLDTKRKLQSDIELTSSLPSATVSLSSTSPNMLSIPHSPSSVISPLAVANTPRDSSMPNVDDTHITNAVATSIPAHVISNSSYPIDSAPSPPPSHIIFKKCQSPGNASIGGLKAKRPSAPNLRRIDTTSAERLNPNLPKLSVMTKPFRSATLTIPPRLTLPSSSLQSPVSPSHLNLVYSSRSPSASARNYAGFDGGNGSLDSTSYSTSSHTPGTPTTFSSPTSAFPALYGHSHTFGCGSSSNAISISTVLDRDRTLSSSPITVQPEIPSTESEALPTFTVSTILPNFLFLGSELTEPSHVEELKNLGVKRIMNLAAELNEDDHGLSLKERFDRYVKIPMRDTVEEENVLKDVRRVCEILDDARLRSAPTYVHCKAGKSRSVTAVIAYLIHANHWTLSRAYGFVLERRKGISPNIGFVSELMNFEEQELGGKSTGVHSKNLGGEDSHGPEEMTFRNVRLRRGGHIRESLPPLQSFASSDDDASAGLDNGHGKAIGSMSSCGIQMPRVVVGDQAQEMEIKDANGRYRHARRAPVDENTLQPSRRVSKAGLESSVFEYV